MIIQDMINQMECLNCHQKTNHVIKDVGYHPVAINTQTGELVDFQIIGARNVKAYCRGCGELILVCPYNIN